MQKRCLVIGGTGFIGCRAVEELARAGMRVAVYARPTSDVRRAEAAGAAIVRGDLKDPARLKAALDGVDCVFHAGEIAVSDPVYLPASRAAIDVIAGAAAAGAVERVVYLSSLSLVVRPDGEQIDEATAAYAPFDDPFHRQKRAAEEMLLARAPVTVLRPYCPYGPGATFLLAIAKGARRLGVAGLPFPGSPDAPLPTIHVDDVAQAMCRAVEPDAPPRRVVHLLDDGRQTLAGFFDLLGRELGTRLVVRHPPVLLQRALARAADRLRRGTEGPAFGPFVDLLAAGCTFSNTSMKRDLGVTLRHPTIESGLRDTAAWMRPFLG